MFVSKTAVVLGFLASLGASVAGQYQGYSGYPNYKASDRFANAAAPCPAAQIVHTTVTPTYSITQTTVKFVTAAPNNKRRDYHPHAVAARADPTVTSTVTRTVTSTTTSTGTTTSTTTSTSLTRTTLTATTTARATATCSLTDTVTSTATRTSTSTVTGTRTATVTSFTTDVETATATSTATVGLTTTTINRRALPTAA
ncbi:hypothetical protein FKP32DRAFT_1603313 [Trametes sanguinea]|nr:hypothetical protein FKP32DRAFT_1603313 [Trametes sanguinea]